MARGVYVTTRDLDPRRSYAVRVTFGDGHTEWVRKGVDPRETPMDRWTSPAASLAARRATPVNALRHAETFISDTLFLEAVGSDGIVYATRPPEAAEDSAAGGPPTTYRLTTTSGAIYVGRLDVNNDRTTSLDTPHGYVTVPRVDVAALDPVAGPS